MNRLYTVLKARSTPPTADEIKLAAGQALDAAANERVLLDLEAASSNDIKRAFEKQTAQAAVSHLSILLCYVHV